MAAHGKHMAPEGSRPRQERGSTQPRPAHHAAGHARPADQPRAQQPRPAAHPRPQQPRVQPHTPAPAAPVSYNAYLDAIPDKNPHHAGRIVATILIVFVVICAAFGGMLFASAMGVRSEAQQVLDLTDTFKENVKNGDNEAVVQNAQEIASLAQSMRETTSGPLWTAATYVPVVGSDISSVRTLAVVCDDLSQEVLLPMANLLQTTDLSSLMSDGAINLDMVSSLSGTFAEIVPHMNEAAETVEALPQAHLPQVASPLEKARTKLTDLDDTVRSASVIINNLPAMLGADGSTKNYLIVAQNNAELRSTGGLPASSGVLTITNGQISMGGFATVVNDPIDPSAQPLYTAEEAAAYGASSVGSFGGVNWWPDWRRDGELFASIWMTLRGQRVDGVVGVDPVFLQQLLAIYGGVTASNGWVVDGSNAAQVLMSDVYWNLPVEEQDPFFAEVAGLAFKQVLGNLGNGSAVGLAQLMLSAGEQHRLQMWFADDTLEDAIKQTSLSGALFDDETEPVVGVYLDDNTYSKMSWYLNVQTQIGQGVLNDDGSWNYEVTTTLQNTMTGDQAASAPDYVTGYAPSRRNKGDMVLGCYLYSPAGGSISNLQITGGVEFGTFDLGGHNVHGGSLNINYGETITLTYTVTTSPSATTALTAYHTPTAQEFAS